MHHWLRSSYCSTLGLKRVNLFVSWNVESLLNIAFLCQREANWLKPEEETIGRAGNDVVVKPQTTNETNTIMTKHDLVMCSVQSAVIEALAGNVWRRCSSLAKGDLSPKSGSIGLERQKLFSQAYSSSVAHSCKGRPWRWWFSLHLSYLCQIEVYCDCSSIKNTACSQERQQAGLMAAVRYAMSM